MQPERIDERGPVLIHLKQRRDAIDASRRSHAGDNMEKQIVAGRARIDHDGFLSQHLVEIRQAIRRARDVQRKLRAQVLADMQRAAHAERDASVRCAQGSQCDDVCVIDYARSDSVERQISIERVGCICACHDHRIADRSADQHSKRRFS